MKKYKLNNLDCASCASKIENSLSKLEDVKFVNVNFANAYYNLNKSLPYVYTTNAVSQSLKAKEFIVYNSDQSANRINIENDIKSRYSI